MGCKRFFLKERKNGLFLNKIDLPYCLVIFFVVVPLPRAPAENASRRPETRANNNEYNKAIRYKSILFKNITFFLSFKKNRLHSIQALRLVNIRLKHKTARKQESRPRSCIELGPPVCGAAAVLMVGNLR